LVWTTPQLLLASAAHQPRSRQASLRALLRSHRQQRCSLH
jgi:hypothetical protein